MKPFLLHKKEDGAPVLVNPAQVAAQFDNALVIGGISAEFRETPDQISILWGRAMTYEDKFAAYLYVTKKGVVNGKFYAPEDFQDA